MTATEAPQLTTAESEHVQCTAEAPERFFTADRVVPAAAFALLAPLYGVLSVMGHRQLRTSGFDLGIFVQQISSYAELRAPTSNLLGTGYNTLGDHFSPITALLAPVYRLFPSPETLLIAQAVLFAAAAVPLTRWAVREFGTLVGVVVAVAYGLSWGVQAALNFDFHEIAFAMPLLAMSMVALGQNRWIPALLWALPLVFVKEDMGLTVAAIGALVAFVTVGRNRVLGLLTIVWGLGWLLLAVKVIIPLLSSNDSYGQGSKMPPLGSGIADTAHGFVAGDSRAATAFLLLAVTAFAALRSPLVLVVVPTVAWRFLSDNSNFWKPIYHYNAILMVIVFAALIDAVARSRRHQQLTERGRRTIFTAVAVVALVALPFLPMARLVTADGWRTDPQATETAAIATRIPDGDTIAASNNLVPQFVATHDVSVFPQRSTDTTTPDWIVVNRADPAGWPADEAGDTKAVDAALASGYVISSESNGIEVLQRVTPLTQGN
ncbi:DUF2079 domain-containing protein [Rhodococcoides kyotonense]|uniref:Uncharacterized membrane protein n=1 Tax=Rhodococcoides kyotonense TaxID=398843 RepID=A0A239IGQ1_9NOCA|nr:DUF2079 domain-containing protein [Rhodococcus kyotonensis]SNS92183.1 Uncharacterized membrane protein [Rhodococcus kyotonensis]